MDIYINIHNRIEAEQNTIKIFSIEDHLTKKINTTVQQVTDGDTFKAIFQVELNGITGHEDSFLCILPVRLAHFDAFEKKTPQGKIAKQVLIDFLAKHGNEVKLKILGKEKWGRILCEAKCGGVDICRYMVDYRDSQYGPIAVPYEGGTKTI